MANVEPEDEELNDLLSGSDDEEDTPAAQDMLDIDSLDLSASGTEPSALSKSNPIFEMMKLPSPLHSEDDDSEEDEVAQKDCPDTDEKEAAAKREKLVEILSLAPPGIDLFPIKSDEDSTGFHSFCLESLRGAITHQSREKKFFYFI